jgi:hypothetical protein
MQRVAISCAILLTFGATAFAGGYVAGDIHNHSTYSDGATSTKTVCDVAVTPVGSTTDADWPGYGLDFFAQSGHGGAFSRNGNYDDFEYDGGDSGSGMYWEDTPGIVFKGDNAGTGYGGKKNMWRWQSIQEYQVVATNEVYQRTGKPVWTGVEWQVPGHEHATVGILDGQFDENPNANALAQFEYLFDYRDNDMSQGAGQGWTGKIANIPDGTDAGYPMHDKAVAGAAWLQQNHPDTSYFLPTHVERKDVWDKDEAYGTGYNIEHLRDFNNAAPTVAFGFEDMPGHQEDDGRGFGPRKTLGDTRGGNGPYSAIVGGLWDAMLGEGRAYYLFGSSDWHRGLATGHGAKDFWPGEYQKDHIYVDDPENLTAQAVVDGMRSGRSFVVQGDLIDDLEFSASANGATAHMGQTLSVLPGDEVTVKIRIHDPVGTNHCEYSFDNPSLAQKGVSQALNMPEVDHVDLIGGAITGMVDPSDPDYTKATNETASVLMQAFRDGELTAVEGEEGWYEFSYTFTAEEGDSQYFRLRGTNMMLDVPFETDAEGNPLEDYLATENIVYDDPRTVGTDEVALDIDIEAWSDLWFYSNPVNVDVVPEPMTMSLLGLGGLALIRRRRR